MKRVCPTPYPGGTCGCGCDCETDEKAFHDMHHQPSSRRDGLDPAPYCRYCRPNRLGEAFDPALDKLLYAWANLWLNYGRNPRSAKREGTDYAHREAARMAIHAHVQRARPAHASDYHPARPDGAQ